MTTHLKPACYTISGVVGKKGVRAVKEKYGDWISLFRFDDDPMDFQVVRGHVSEEVFDIAIKNACIDRDSLGEIQHTFARWIPVRHPEFSIEFDFYPKGRGAFKVTVAHTKEEQ
jgi:hypothetical protein